MTSQRARFALWLVGVVLLLAGFAFGVAPNLKIGSDLAELLPGEDRDPASEAASRQIAAAFATRLLLLVGADDFAKARAAAEAVATSLKASPAFTSVQLEVDAKVLQASGTEQAARFGLLTTEDRARLIKGEAAAIAQEAERALYSPTSFARLTKLADDPLSLFDRQLRAALPAPGKASLEGGVLVIRDAQKAWVLVLAATRGSPFAQAQQTELATGLSAARNAAEALGATVLTSGVAPHAVAASARAKSEMVFLGGGDLLACTLLLLLVFKSLRPALLGLMSVGLGVVAALCVVQGLFGGIHSMTLVFGTSLVGVAMDYAIHFHCDQFRDPAHWQPHDAPTHIGSSLALGLGTAVLGYAAFATAPLPILRQMAVFSATGLMVAAATVWLAFPTLARPSRLAGTVFWPRLGAALRPRRAPLWAWLLLVALALPGLLRLTAVDDVRQLQSPSSALLAQEQQVRALLGSAYDSRHFLVQGDSAQQVLEREEALLARLDALPEDVATAVSRAVPSLKTQAANRVLVAPLLSEGGVIPKQLAALGYGAEIGARLADEFAQGAVLTPEAALASPRLHALAPLWLGAHEGQWRSAVTLAGAGESAVLAQAAEGLPGVRWHDPVVEASTALGHQRRAALSRLALVYAVIAVLLVWRYGLNEGLRALAAPLGASALTLAVLGWCGVGLNLFHVLALLLVLGIGNDYAIFLREGVRAGAPPIASRLAVGLAALTTLFSFGGLAFSSTPFLQSLGLTLVLGIALTMTLALFTAPQDQQHR